MFLNAYIEKMKIILIIIYFFIAQLMFQGNSIYKLWPILILIILASEFGKISIRLFLLILLMPIILYANLIIEDNTNIEGWTFVNIHLCSAIFSYIVVTSHTIKKYFDEKVFTKFIIIYGLTIIFITLLEYLFGFPPGRTLLDSQNLTSTVLLLTIPFILSYIHDNKIKYAYVILSLITIGLLIKSRGASVILIFLIFYLLSQDFKKINKDNKYITIIIISIPFIILLASIFYFNEKFKDLITGNSLFYRLLAWSRYIDITLGSDPFFGNGPSGVIVNFNKYQNIYPQIELISGLNTFVNPHSEWILFFSAGGIFALSMYLIINLYIIYKYFILIKNKKIDQFQKNIFICYLILLFSAQYDINNATYSTLILFYMLKICLLKNIIYEKPISFNKYIISACLALFVASSLFLQKQSINIFTEYKDFAARTLSEKEVNSQIIDAIAPHFMISDTLKAVNYLNTAAENFSDNKFSKLVEDARNFNKYAEPSLQLGFQYFGFKRDKNKTLSVVSDILYLTLVREGVINIATPQDNIKVIICDKLTYTLSKNHHIVCFTPKTLDNLMLAASSFGRIDVESGVENNFTFITDSGEINFMMSDVIKKLFSNLQVFSLPLPI